MCTASRSIGRTKSSSPKPNSGKATASARPVSLSPTASPITNAKQAKAIAEGSVEAYCIKNDIAFHSVNVSMKSSSTGMYVADIVIVTPDEDKYKELSPRERFRIIKGSVVGLNFIETMTGTLDTVEEIAAEKNRQERVEIAKEKEISHNNANTLRTSKSPHPSIFRETDQNAEAVNQNAKAMNSKAEPVNLGYNAGIAVNNTRQEFPSSGDKLNGLKIVISGKFDAYASGRSSFLGLHIGKDTLSEAIRQNGGECLDRVKPGTDLLVVGEGPGVKKCQSAKMLSVKIITVHDLHCLATGATSIAALRLKEDAHVEEYSVMSFKSTSAKSASSTQKRNTRYTSKRAVINRTSKSNNTAAKPSSSKLAATIVAESASSTQKRNTAAKPSSSKLAATIVAESVSSKRKRKSTDTAKHSSSKRKRKSTDKTKSSSSNKQATSVVAKSDSSDPKKSVAEDSDGDLYIRPNSNNPDGKKSKSKKKAKRMHK
eukprot:scaffold6832_cov81-Skeletonema_menzelii.AAC.37